MTEQHPGSDNPLRDIAQNPNAYAQYLTEVLRVVRDMAKSLDTLEGEVSVHVRGTHVEGDRWYHARSRARPVEKPLRDALKALQRSAAGLEKAAYARHAHDDQVKALPGERRQKQLAKEYKKNPALAGNSGTVNSTPTVEAPLDEPVTSLIDVAKWRRSA